MTWLWVADGDNGVAADRCLTGFGDGHHTRVSDGLRFETLVHGEPEHDRQVGAANQKEVEAAEVRPSRTAVLAPSPGAVECRRAAGAPPRTPRRGLIQTGFPSRALAMRRSEVPSDTPEQLP